MKAALGGLWTMKLMHCTWRTLSNPMIRMKASGYSFLASSTSVQYLGWVSAPKHGQLPHGPVPAIVVPGGPVVVPAHKSSLLELSNRKRENKPKEAITVPNSGAIRIVYTAI